MYIHTGVRIFQDLWMFVSVNGLVLRITTSWIFLLVL